jgi:hypothetical protein
MEAVDNAIMLLIPAMMHRLPVRCSGSLALAPGAAGVAAFPVNRWLIAKGRGHAVVHQHHASAPGADPNATPPGHSHTGHSH